MFLLFKATDLRLVEERQIVIDTVAMSGVCIVKRDKGCESSFELLKLFMYPFTPCDRRARLCLFGFDASVVATWTRRDVERGQARSVS